MSETLGRPTTPLTSPKYGVYLSESTIRSIVGHCLPRLTSSFHVSTLRSDQSLYNRIYFLNSGTGENYVLKVSGRVAFKPRIENEVSSLLLLQRFCPDIPAPRPIAWSRGGSEITKQILNEDNGTPDGIQTDSLEILGDDLRRWILMTRLPGTELDVSKLSAEQAFSVATQLADMVFSWRQNIPKPNCAGNINITPSEIDTSSDGISEEALLISSLKIHIYGLLGAGTGFEQPMKSLLDYWKPTLLCETAKLQTKPKLAKSLNSELLPPLVSEFITRTLPHLSIFKEASAGAFPFTHTDFAPRNVLVAESDPSKVTGIIDFEFAGFFPTPQEFFPEISNVPRPEGIGLGAEGDWPRDMYFEFLQNLEDRGEPTPLNSFTRKTTEWDELLALRKLEVFLAPPILANDEVQVANLLEYSRREVEKALEELGELAKEMSS